MSIPKRNSFMDKQSCKDFNRLQYKKLVRKMKKYAPLYIKSIDRLDATMRRSRTSGEC